MRAIKVFESTESIMHSKTLLDHFRVGIDPFVGANGNYKLSEEIISHLEILELPTLNRIKRPYQAVLKGDYWFTSKDLGFSGIWAEIWDKYINTLKVIGISLSSEEDTILWHWNKATGQISTKEAYIAIVQSLSTYNVNWWNNLLWKWSLPLKVKCFFWFLMENKVLIW